MAQPNALRRRIIPAVPLTLELTNDDGSAFRQTFRLAFDFNAFALIEERTGLDMTGLLLWSKLSPSSLSVMFWAAVLAHQPEFSGDEGLGVIRSYMDAGNWEKITWALFEAYAKALPEAQKKALLEAKNKMERGENPTQPPAIPEMPAEIAKNI